MPLRIAGYTEAQLRDHVAMIAPMPEPCAAADGADFVEAWTVEASQDSYVCDVAYAEIDGLPVVVAGVGNTVTVWDLESGARLSGSPGPEPEPEPEPELEPEPGAASASSSADLACVAVTQSAGKPVAVTGDIDGRIRTWELLPCGAAPLGEPLTVLGGRVHALAATRGAGCGLVLIARGAGETSTVYSVPVADQTVEVWDIATRMRLRVLHHGGYTGSVALGEGDGRAVAVASASFSASPLVDASDLESRIFLWDLETGDRIGEPLEPAHEGESIGSVAVGSVAGRTIVVGASDGRLHVWERGEVRPSAQISDAGGVEFVAWGGTGDRPLVLAGGGGDPRRPDRRSRLRVWDPRDWRLLGEIEPGFGVLRRFASAPDGRVILPWAGSVKVLRYVGGA